MSRRGINYVPDSDEEENIVPSDEVLTDEQLLSIMRSAMAAKQAEEAREHEPLSPLSPPTPKLGDLKLKKFSMQ